MWTPQTSPRPGLHRRAVDVAGKRRHSEYTSAQDARGAALLPILISVGAAQAALDGPDADLDPVLQVELHQTRERILGLEAAWVEMEPASTRACLARRGQRPC